MENDVSPARKMHRRLKKERRNTILMSVFMALVFYFQQ